MPVGEPVVGLQRFEPSQDLSHFVEHYWSVLWKDEPKVQRETVPHPSVHLVLEFGRSKLHGVSEKRFSRSIEGTGRVLGVKFRPGGFRAFFDRSVSELTNQIVAPTVVFGLPFRDIEQKTLACSSAELAFRKIDSFLVSRAPVRTPELESITTIVGRIEMDQDVFRAEQIATQFSIGLRRLQRMFREYVGVSPKWVIQRFRLIQAAEAMREANGKTDFAQLAISLGYSDQPHFIRDFKTMVGMSPRKYQQSIGVV